MTEAGQSDTMVWKFLGWCVGTVREMLERTQGLERNTYCNDFQGETSSLFWISQIIGLLASGQVAYFSFLLLPLHPLPFPPSPPKTRMTFQVD